MPNCSLNRQIGGIYMIMGTEIGAGVLALPIIFSHVGIFFSSIILFFAWAVMLYTALLICEADSTLDPGMSFATMAGKFLGKWGKGFLTVVFWCTLSAIAMAYISAAGSTFNHMLNLSSTLTSAAFVIIFGGCVISGTLAVDYINRILLSIKLGVFVLAIVLLSSTLHLNYLLTPVHSHGIIEAFPAIIVAFVLHSLIPTVSSYLHNDQAALRRVVIIGSIIPLILYILWVIAIIGNIPSHGPNSFDLLYSKTTQANVGDLITILDNNTSNNLIIAAINFVAIISVTTSFLGTSISLYHFTQDVVGPRSKHIVRQTLLPTLITFLIPLLMVILYPNAFIMALSYAGIGATILFVLLPILITKKMIKSGHPFSFPILQNQLLLNLSFVIGLGVIFIQF